MIVCLPIITEGRMTVTLWGSNTVPLSGQPLSQVPQAVNLGTSTVTGSASGNADSEAKWLIGGVLAATLKAGPLTTPASPITPSYQLGQFIFTQYGNPGPFYKYYSLVFNVPSDYLGSTGVAIGPGGLQPSGDFGNSMPFRIDVLPISSSGSTGTLSEYYCLGGTNQMTPFNIGNPPSAGIAFSQVEVFPRLNWDQTGVEGVITFTLALWKPSGGQSLAVTLSNDSNIRTGTTGTFVGAALQVAPGGISYGGSVDSGAQYYACLPSFVPGSNYGFPPGQIPLPSGSTQTAASDLFAGAAPQTGTAVFIRGGTGEVSSPISWTFTPLSKTVPMVFRTNRQKAVIGLNTGTVSEGIGYALSLNNVSNS